MDSKRNTWTEQIYKYTEFYYWEPQHLNKQAIPGKLGRESFMEVKSRIRKREVPLNALFNILARLLPSTIIKKFIETFLNGIEDERLLRVEFIDIYDEIGSFSDFTQPDLVLESSEARVFIEMKIDAKLSIDQLYKYLFLHALWNHRTGIRKKPYILFLTKRDIYNQWDSKEKKSVFNVCRHVDGLMNYLVENALPNQFGKGDCVDYLHNEVMYIIQQLILGHAKWEDVGRLLKKESDSLYGKEDNPCAETVYKLINDLLSDLINRGLFKIETR